MEIKRQDRHRHRRRPRHWAWQSPRLTPGKAPTSSPADLGSLAAKAGEVIGITGFSPPKPTLAQGG